MTDLIFDRVQILTDRLNLPDKSRAELETALLKWFKSYVLKSMKLDDLRAIYRAGAFTAFADLLLASSSVELITLLSKLDKNRPEVQMRSVPQAMKHLEQLAKLELDPAPKLATLVEKPKANSKRKRTRNGIIADSKY
jgi:hypothetical protein